MLRDDENGDSREAQQKVWEGCMVRARMLLTALSLVARFCSGRSGQVAAIVVAAYYLCSGRSGPIGKRVVTHA